MTETVDMDTGEITDAPITEADAAEPAEPRPDDFPDEPTQATPAQPGEPESSAFMEEIGKKLDALNKSVTTRIGTILGDEVQNLVRCELCGPGNIPGWRWNMPAPEHVVAEVMHAIGQRTESDYQEDRHSRKCAECDGLGEVLTGSRVNGRQLLPCVGCSGNGWIALDNLRGSVPTVRFGNGDTGNASPDAHIEFPVVPAGPEPPEVAALRAAGYAVIAPPSV